MPKITHWLGLLFFVSIGKALLLCNGIKAESDKDEVAVVLSHLNNNNSSVKGKVHGGEYGRAH